MSDVQVSENGHNPRNDLQLGEIVPCEIPNYSIKKNPILAAGNFGLFGNELNAKEQHLVKLPN